MKNLFLLVAFFALGFQAFAQYSTDPELQVTQLIETSNTIEIETIQAPTSKLTVLVKGLDSDKGTLMIGIYDSKGNWLSKTSFSEKTAIIDGKATVVFDNIPAGIYAISTYHDENDNKKLDSGIFGIPKEPYAASRGAKGIFGPPKWNDAKFEVTESTHTEEIKY